MTGLYLAASGSMLVALAVMLALAPLSFAHAPKGMVIFLLDKACNMHDDYSKLFSDSYVVCTEEKNWTVARENLFGFEKYYKVIYVTHDNQHVKAAQNVFGETWFRNGNNYAYSVNNPVVIAHEKMHLDCMCHFTSDGKHDSERAAHL
jgi:hypothetical protein